MTRYGLALLGLSLFFVGCDKLGGSKNVELKNDDQKVSYSIGQQIGRSLKADGFNVDVDILAESVRDSIKGTASKMTPEQMQEVMMKMQQKMMAKQTEGGKENKEKGNKFLAENKKRKEVKATASGLQYEVMTEGKGANPKVTDTVKVHYKGTLLDGSEFDSSYKRNEPAQFPLNGVIRGWTEGLQLMKPGAKYKFYIPAELAYGPQGRPGIPANSTLTFEIELIEIVGKK